MLYVKYLQYKSTPSTSINNEYNQLENIAGVEKGCKEIIFENVVKNNTKIKSAKKNKINYENQI